MQAIGDLNSQIYLQLKNIKPWTPKRPHLYDIKAEFINEKGEIEDEIMSYSGMRKISLLNKNGINIKEWEFNMIRQHVKGKPSCVQVILYNPRRPRNKNAIPELHVPKTIPLTTFLIKEDFARHYDGLARMNT